MGLGGGAARGGELGDGGGSLERQHLCPVEAQGREVPARAADVAGLFDAAEEAFGPATAVVADAGRAVRTPMTEFA